MNISDEFGVQEMKCAKRRKKEDEDRLSRLPISVALYILSLLPLNDAARTAALSKYWRMLAPKKCAKRKGVEEENDQDRFSQLPKSVALYILSFLSIKDAARTSALSKHWTRRWLFAGVFDFDTSLVLKHPDTPTSMVFRHTAKYVEWVSTVLQSHREASFNPLMLSKLRIRMRLTETFQNELEGWLSYAFARRVQSLELDFLVNSEPNSYGSDTCKFNARLPQEFDFNCLRSLSLAGVEVTEKFVNYFLCNFPLLESLKVCSAALLEGVTVRGSSLALKHLEITYCPWLNHVIVHDTSLVSLKIHWVTNLSLVNNPKLVDVRSATRGHESENILGQLSGCLSTVQNLAFDTGYVDHLEDIDMVPELSEVKQLTLAVDPLLEDSLIRLTTLLSLSPKLEKLVLEFVFRLKNVEKKKRKPSTMKTKFYRSPRFPVQQRVQVVEVRGYYGEVAEDNALTRVLRHLVATPKRVIFNPTNLGSDDMVPPYSDPRFEVEPSAEKRAELLKKVLPSSVEFIVI